MRKAGKRTLVAGLAALNTPSGASGAESTAVAGKRVAVPVSGGDGEGGAGVASLTTYALPLATKYYTAPVRVWRVRSPVCVCWLYLRVATGSDLRC